MVASSWWAFSTGRHSHPYRPYLADVNVHPTKQEVRISKERELMALVSEAIANSLKEQTLIPDALENLAKSTVRNREKVEQTILPTQRKYALL